RWRSSKGARMQYGLLWYERVMRIAWLALAATACGSSPAPAPTAPASAAPGPASPPPGAPASTAAAASGGPVAPAAAHLPYPAAERRPVTDSYGEVRVVDDYRWLEDGKDPAVIAWTAAQNQLTRSQLDALPDRPRIRARVAELLSSKAPSYVEVTVIG